MSAWQASERKDQQIRDLEVRSSDVEDKYAEALEDAQKQLDEFGSHSRARDWQVRFSHFPSIFGHSRCN